MKLAGLVVLTCAVYWPVRHYGLVDYDDITYLIENPFVKGGITFEAVRDAFAHPRFSNYAPLVSISYYLDQNIFQLRPGPMHVENVALHLICGLLLWRLLSVATGQIQHAFLVTALFLIHPMHVESVAWLSERKDVLSTAWLLGAMLAYFKFTHGISTAQKALTYAVVLALFTLSLLSKSMGVTLPVVLLLLDFWPLKRWPMRTWLQLTVEKIPLIALACVVAIVAARAQHSGGSVTTLTQLDVIGRMENAEICYVIYIAKLVLPINLAVFYPHPMSRPPVAFLASALLMAVLTWSLYRMRSKRPYLIMGWLWFIITLLPVIGLVQIGAQAMADRYSYFPAIGLFIAITWWLGDLIKSTMLRSICCGTVILSYAILAHRQVKYWIDTKSLFTHALSVTEDNYLAHEELAADAYNKGDRSLAFVEYQHAIKNWQDPRAYHGLGNCWLGINELQAIYNYRRAVELLPTSVNYRTDLAVALRHHGDLQQAKIQAQTALSIKPDYAPANAELAIILAQLQQQGE